MAAECFLTMTIDIARPQHELELAFTTQQKNLLKIYVIGALQDLECVDLGVQLPGVNQRPHDVVAQIPETQSDAA